MDKKDIVRTTITVVISLLVLNLWSYFFPTKVAQEEHSIKQSKSISNATLNNHLLLETTLDKDKNHANIVQNAILPKIVKIQNAKIRGSISTLGLKVNDLVLLNHKKSLDPNSGNVTLLREGENKSYFISLSFDSPNKEDVPQANTIWTVDKDSLSTDGCATFSWVNKLGVEFLVKLSIDNAYMIKVDQKINNRSNEKITFVPAYSIVKDICDNGSNIDSKEQTSINVVGSINNVLKEYKYDNLFKDSNSNINAASVQWIGDTEKYWMCAIIPNQGVQHKLEFCPYYHEGQATKKVMIIKCSDAVPVTLGAGQSLEYGSKFFCGAKEISLLDQYKKDYNITLFDRGVDFGWLYFITKPLFYLLSYLNQFFQNFGISIICLTFVIRLALFPMLRKSETSLQGIRRLQPMIDELNKRYAGDKQTLRVKLLELYQKEKVNPLSFSVGCLPVVLQIPIWYGVYKVLQVVIELRHAPFFLWIKDLAGPDTMYIFNLFGLLDIPLPTFLQIGILPVLFGISLYFQQHNSPQVLDPVQQKVFKFLPIILTFVLAQYSAGLLVYWTCNNVLGILQQHLLKFFARRKLN